MKRMMTLCAAMLGAVPAVAETPVERGAYIATIAGCGDCHTPGYFLGQPDMEHPLSGSDVGFEIPGLGVFHGPNLTPEAETGLGAWSEDQIVTAFRTGVRPDGRILAPAMPWRGYAAMTDDDAYAVAAYLKSLAPVSNKVPGPFGPTEASPGFVMRVIPPGN